MATVKEITVNAIIYHAIPTTGYYWTRKVFKTFTDDNGNKTYYINGEQVDKEAGNESYKAIRKANAEFQQTKNCKDFIKREWSRYYRAKKNHATTNDCTLHEADTFKQEVKEYEISYEEIIEKLEASIDRHVEYIENGRQYEEACKRNARIAKEIDHYKKLIAERQ